MNKPLSRIVAVLLIPSLVWGDFGSRTFNIGSKSEIHNPKSEIVFASQALADPGLWMQSLQTHSMGFSLRVLASAALIGGSALVGGWRGVFSAATVLVGVAASRLGEGNAEPAGLSPGKYFARVFLVWNRLMAAFRPGNDPKVHAWSARGDAVKPYLAASDKVSAVFVRLDVGETLWIRQSARTKEPKEYVLCADDTKGNPVLVFRGAVNGDYILGAYRIDLSSREKDPIMARVIKEDKITNAEWLVFYRPDKDDRQTKSALAQLKKPEDRIRFQNVDMGKSEDYHLVISMRGAAMERHGGISQIDDALWPSRAATESEEAPSTKAGLEFLKKVEDVVIDQGSVNYPPIWSYQEGDYEFVARATRLQANQPPAVSITAYRHNKFQTGWYLAFERVSADPVIALKKSLITVGRRADETVNAGREMGALFKNQMIDNIITLWKNLRVPNKTKFPIPVRELKNGWQYVPVWGNVWLLAYALEDKSDQEAAMARTAIRLSALGCPAQWNESTLRSFIHLTNPNRTSNDVDILTGRVFKRFRALTSTLAAADSKNKKKTDKRRAEDAMTGTLPGIRPTRNDRSDRDSKWDGVFGTGSPEGGAVPVTEQQATRADTIANAYGFIGMSGDDDDIFGGRVDESIEGTMVVPAAGNIFEEITQRAKYFRNIRKIVMIDWNYPVPPKVGAPDQFVGDAVGRALPAGRRETEFRNLLNRFCMEWGGEVVDSRIGPQGARTTLLEAETGRRIEVEMLSQDYYRYRPDELHAITYIHYPGPQGVMSDSIDFWAQAVNQTVLGGYLILEEVDVPAFLQDRLDQWGLRLVYTPPTVRTDPLGIPHEGPFVFQKLKTVDSLPRIPPAGAHKHSFPGVVSKSWWGKLFAIAKAGPKAFKEAFERGDFLQLSGQFPEVFKLAVAAYRNSHSLPALVQALAGRVASFQEGWTYVMPVVRAAITEAVHNAEEGIFVTEAEAAAWLKERMPPAIEHWIQDHERIYPRGNASPRDREEPDEVFLRYWMNEWTSDLQKEIILLLMGKSSTERVMEAYQASNQNHSDHNTKLETGQFYAVASHENDAPPPAAIKRKLKQWARQYLAVNFSLRSLPAAKLPEGVPLHAVALAAAG